MIKRKIHIDFETRSKVDIKVCGAARYASDPSTRILCTCWAVDNSPVLGVLGEEVPAMLRTFIEENEAFIADGREAPNVFSAFNAMFEQLIWKYRWPHLRMPRFECTRALCAAHGLPQGLDRACRSLHIGYAKDIEGRRLINLYSLPRKDGTFNELEGEDAKKMLQYCAKDVVLSRRITQRLPALSEAEQKVYDWTARTNIRGLDLDVDLAEKAEGIANALQNDGNHELALLTGNTIFSVSQIARIKSYLERVFGITTESLDKEAIEELLLRDSLPDTARRILELRRDLSQTSVKKFQRARLSVCSDGKVRDTLVYHGAATGRWTSQVVQFQNLPKYTVSDPETALKLVSLGDPKLFDLCYKSPMLALSGCARGMVLPPAGKKLAVVDYNAIEARVLLWAAGQQDAVDSFHRGRDIYVEMARMIYRNEKLTKENKKERNLGKTTVLGCGYGLGHLKFQATCDSYGIDLGEKTEYDERKDPKTGGDIKVWYAPLAKRAVDTYRQTYTQVPKFWYGMQNAADSCVRTGKPTSFRGFSFVRGREFLYMQLPSGRRLAYHRPGIDKDGLYYYTEDSASFNYIKKRTYGGRLVENAIQATARDILAHGILKLEAVGFPVIMTVHDENVVEIRGEEYPTTAKDTLKEVIEIMCSLPDWAKGCPITAEGFVTDRYRKG